MAMLLFLGDMISFSQSSTSHQNQKNGTHPSIFMLSLFLFVTHTPLPFKTNGFYVEKIRSVSKLNHAYSTFAFLVISANLSNIDQTHFHVGIQRMKGCPVLRE